MSSPQQIAFDSIEEAIADIKKGKIIIVVDDENRENEGDFIAAAECATPEIINFMAQHGRGLICTPLAESYCTKLDLYPMVHDYALMDGGVPTAAANEDDMGTNISTAGSMTRFLPIDGYLYTINFNELVLFQLASNYKPNPWIRINTETQAETLFRLNELLFVGSVNGMLLYDVENASDPIYINRIEHMRSCDPVVADLQYAYVTLRGGTNCFTDINELQIIDIQTPENLQVVSRKALFNPHGLAVYENHLMVCDGSAGIKILDVTDKTQPEIVSNYPIGFAYDVIINYPTAMVVGEEMLFQYDVSKLPELTLLSQTPIHSNE